MRKGDNINIVNGEYGIMDLPKIFGSMVFNDKVMQERLPRDTYEEFIDSVKNGKKLSLQIGNVVASAMKDWAIEKGVTHFTHWFQPMTDITAEKHDSFISPTKDRGIIMDFSGKELIKGEPDASSFPSGGLRATFEARGYTAWDPTSCAFIKDGVLCIPTVFCSYSGEALDKKTPLLRSTNAINKQILRILRLFGNDDVKNVETTIGAEQEYFLIDKKMYDQRKDLIFCGRTLFGAKPVKGQDLDDHYFRALKLRVSEFMRDLDQELWKLGVPAKTEHNEVAPSQHELAQVYVKTNTATDQNQITMETMKTVAEKHGLVCLLHEKPFKGINGSGKHDNWSIQTDTGINLLEPGISPRDNAQFLLFLCAVIKGVDEYADLLRVSIASVGNDLRLGAKEAPPAIVSVFVGDELMDILESIESGVVYTSRGRVDIEVGVDVLPYIPKDTTDRNRTSPFAFTGNKFEFRMLGSSQSIASPNMIINTIVAEELSQFADILEKADDFNECLKKLLSKTIKEHKRILFNGNNYSNEWVEEAKKRGLLNLRTMVDALPYYIKKKNIDLFEKHKVLSEKELRSRYEVKMENYCKVVHIEALTMLDMARKEIMPAVNTYINEIAETLLFKKKLQEEISCEFETSILKELSALNSKLYNEVNKLAEEISKAEHLENTEKMAVYYKDTIIKCMEDVRKVADRLELITAEKYWPYPTYQKILFSV